MLEIFAWVTASTFFGVLILVIGIASADYADSVDKKGESIKAYIFYGIALWCGAILIGTIGTALVRYT